MEKATLQRFVRLFIASAGVASLCVGCATDPSASKTEKKLVLRLPAQTNSSPVAQPKPVSAPSDAVRPSFEERFNATAARLRSEIEKLVKSGQYDKARDVLWKSATDPNRELARRLAPFRDQLLRQYVNRAQFIQTTNELARSAAQCLANEDFAGARSRLFGIKRVRVYPGETAKALDEVRQELARTGISGDDADRAVAAARSVLESVFSDQTLKEGRTAPGDTYKPDESALRGKLAALDRSLAAQGVPEDSRDRVKKTIDGIATPALRALWRPQNEEKISPPDAIGTSTLNDLIEASRDDLYANTVLDERIFAEIFPKRFCLTRVASVDRRDGCQWVQCHSG